MPVFRYARSLSTAVIFGAVVTLAVAAGAFSQSTQQEFPTPITEPDISATIKPRDIGDARLTTHWYLLEAGQGDLFVNIATRNLNADFDVFNFGSLAPVTKVVVFADAGEYETGRVLYFRKPERLLLRVQGRTPGDDAATYRLKFAGSFIASRANVREPEVPKATVETEGGVRVNSVGTILPTAKKVETVRPTTDEARRTDEPVTKSEEKAETAADTESPPANVSEPKPEPESKEETSAAKTEEPLKTARTPKPARRRSSRIPPPESPGTDASAPEGPKGRADRVPPRGRARTGESKTGEPAKVDPLANVKLVILFKDGSRIDRALPEVLRFTVDRGTLTVVNRDGTIGRYSMVDVAKVTIE